MRDHFAEVTAAGLVVYGVSFDTPAENKAFKEKFNFQYSLLCDTKREMGPAYGADRGPGKGPKRISYVIDEDGRVLFAYDNVNAGTHLDVVLADVRAG